MNSVVQLMWMVPSLKKRYTDKAATIFQTAPEDPAKDFATQVSLLEEGFKKDGEDTDKKHMTA